jgi:hypothetical protein
VICRSIEDPESANNYRTLRQTKSFIRWSLTNELDENIAVFVDRFRKAMFE